MASKYTHALNVAVGLDITSLLSPANIPGIKQYLHVENDADLLNAIVQDQYGKLEKAIREAGFTIINTAFGKLSSENEENLASESTMVAPQQTDIEMQTTKDVNEIAIDEIKRAISDIEEQDGEITEINISGERVADIQNADDLRKATGLSEDVTINFEDMDDGELMVISYLDREQNLKFRVVDDKEKMEDK
ncbi:hypothetical protein QUW44_07655 [Limosilactobacillus pontis]|uniref:Uncharacterized protein n=1 Tax=Limosilactobacillus pontis TaxID=35787 RepID=A0ABT7UZR1_9LACO|nr:hypothetical protein [Limosilactobacillus pontis]MDM8267022.1 hypothetical protein [Limosilactobacillus pontis]